MGRPPMATAAQPGEPGFISVFLDIPFPTSIPNGNYTTFDPIKGIAVVTLTLREGTRAFFRNRPIVGPTSFRDLQQAWQTPNRAARGLRLRRCQQTYRRKTGLSLALGQSGLQGVNVARAPSPANASAGNTVSLLITESIARRPAHIHSKRKRLPTSLLVAFIYAGNDLRSHTLGACSTIGPAGLNLRRLEGVSAFFARGSLLPKS